MELERRNGRAARFTYLGKLVIVLNEIKHHLDRALVYTLHLSIVTLAQNVGCHDSGNVPGIHLVTRLLVDSVEGRDPVQEAKQYLHGIAMGLG